MSRVTWRSAGWLAVFAVDAALPDRQLAHRLGALAFLLLFGTLVVGEIRASRVR